MISLPLYKHYKDPGTHRRELIRTGVVSFFVGLMLGGFGGVFLFLRITGGNATASEPISAPTLSLPAEGQGSSSDAVSTGTPPQETSEVANAGAAPPIEGDTDSLGPQLFRIVSGESEARFSVYETFPEGTAIGTTQDVAGDLIIDFSNPKNSQLGVIRVNLRTLRTDDPDRDNSIRCCVLLTALDEYEFSDFVPTSIEFLPEQIELGEPITIQITGDLTLRGRTAPVVFAVELTVVSPSLVEGIATAQVNRSDFGILNDADNGFDYHGVAEQVTLEFEFVARAVLE